MYKRAEQENEDFSSFANYIFNGEPPFVAGRLKIKQSDAVNQDIQSILFDSYNLAKQPRIYKNYIYFYNNLDSNDKREQVLKWFRRLCFVELALDQEKDNPQKIFERINSTGLPLTQGDLIRNYILMGLDPIVQKELYEFYWKKIEANTKKDNKTFLDDFLKCYITIKAGETIKETKIYYEFIRRIEIKNNSNIRNILEDISKFSEMYRYILSPQDSNLDHKIKREIDFIGEIKTRVADPLILIFLRDFYQGKLTKDKLIEL